MAHDVFISYTTRDKAIADAVCHALEAQRIRCWIAPRDLDLHAGVSWKAGIVAAIRSSQVMVLIFSGEVNTSSAVRQEVDIAFEARRPIVPFRIEDVAPIDELLFCIAGRHWLDALTPPVEQHIDRLITAVRRFTAEPVPELAPIVPEPLVEPPALGPVLEPVKDPESEPPDRSPVRDAVTPAPTAADVARGPALARWSLAAAAASLMVVLGLAGVYAIRTDYAELEAKGVAAYHERNYHDALPLLKQAADGGRPEAQLYLGRMYFYGHGVERDYAQAEQWAAKASDQGVAEAEALLGISYLEGHDPSDNLTNFALDHLRRAASRGSALAMAKLGWVYQFGKGVTPNLAEAIRWYELAAQLRDTSAQCALGTHALEGSGSDKKADYAAAVKWFQLAAAQNAPCGLLNLGDLHWAGLGVEKSYDLATEYWDQAGGLGDAAAQQKMQWALPPLFPHGWRWTLLKGQDRLAELSRIKASSIAANLRDVEFRRMRNIELDFYQDAALFEVEVSLPGGDPGILTYVRRGNEIAHVNGRWEQFRAFNGLMLDDEQKVRQFLLFRIAAAGARVVETPAQLVWTYRGSHEEYGSVLRPLEFTPKTAGGWDVRSTVQIDTSLFKHDFSLNRNGSITSDKGKPQLLAFDLPVQYWKFDRNGLRRPMQ